MPDPTTVITPDFSAFLRASPLMIILIVILATLLASTVAVLMFIAALSRHRKAGDGELRLVGEVASVEEDLQPEGSVIVRGELWRARSRSGATVTRGRGNVRVVGAKAYLLEVEEVTSDK